jgi:hypothetical protein
MFGEVVVLKPERFDSAHAFVRREPFPFLVASGTLADAKRDALRHDFPKFKEAGYLPYSESECGPTVVELINEVTSPEMADTLGAQLGIERLSQYPTMVTICRFLNRRHGAIHTDGKAKIATALFYLNDTWNSTSGGCFRFLHGPDDIDDIVVPELEPLYGNFAIFKRTDNSFHGHLPFEGERRVIQIAWLTSEAEKLRKTRTGRLSRFLKRVVGDVKHAGSSHSMPVRAQRT